MTLTRVAPFAIAMLIASACSTPSPSPIDASGSSSGLSPSPSAAPQASEPAGAGALFAEVALASLPVYLSPDPGAAVLAEVHEGQLVYIIRQAPAGWARLEFPYLHRTSVEYVFGWVPWQMAGEPAFRRADLAGCGQRADVASLAAMSPAEQLTCLGTQELKLEGWATVEPGAQWLYSGEPAWLATPSSLLLMGVPPELGGPAIPIHLGPRVGEEWPVGSHVTVTATFNHEASASCRRTGQADVDAETDAESILWCQQQFVVEEFHISDG